MTWASGACHNPVSSDSSTQVSLLLPGSMEERSMHPDILGAMAWNYMFPQVFQGGPRPKGEVYALRHWPHRVPAHRAAVKPALIPWPLVVACLVRT